MRIDVSYHQRGRRLEYGADADAGLPCAVERTRISPNSRRTPILGARRDAILRHDEGDVVAFNRLGRAYEAIGSFDEARAAFSRALDIDPGNAIGTRRLRQMQGRKG